MATKIVPRKTKGTELGFLLPASLQENRTDGGRPGLRQTPQIMTDAARRISDACVGLGVKEVDGDRVLLIDPKAATVARILARVLPSASLVQTRSGVSPDQLTMLLRKFGPMVSFYTIALQVDADVDDSRAVVAAVMRKERAATKQAIEAALASKRLRPDVRQRLEAIFAQLKALEDKMQQAQVDRRGKTTKKTKRHAAQVATMGQHEDLLRTMIDIQAGKQVDDERAAEAVAAWNEVEREKAAAAAPAATAANRRAGGRTTVH